MIHNGALVNHAFTYEQLFEPNVLGSLEVRAQLGPETETLPCCSSDSPWHSIGVLQTLQGCHGCAASLTSDIMMPVQRTRSSVLVVATGTMAGLERLTCLLARARQSSKRDALFRHICAAPVHVSSGAHLCPLRPR